MTGRGGKRGSALLVTFMIVLLVGLLCSSMTRSSSQQALSAVRTRDFLMAKAIAEAGVNQAYNQIKHNYQAIGNEALFPLTSFADGTYDVTVASAGSNRAQMVSVGTYGSMEARVTVDLLNLARHGTGLGNDGTPLDLSVFTNYAVLAGGKVEWRGGGEMQGSGRVRANGPVDMIGGGYLRGPRVDVFSSQQVYVQGSSRVEGDAHAPSFKGKPDQITGLKLTNQVPYITVPVIDLLPFYQHAQSNGQVRSGNVLINSDTTVFGGVMWVNGNLKIANGKCRGCFIATGDIDISTSQEMAAPGGYPLLVSRDGTIKITSTGKLSGLVYACNGSIEWTGGGLLKGSLVAAQDVVKGGGSDLVVNYGGEVPVVPGTGGAPTSHVDYVVITAWQE